MKIHWLLPLLLITACGKAEKKPEPIPLQQPTTTAVGAWEITTPDGQHATVVLEVDGTGTRKLGSHSQDGAWEQMGEQIWIFWDNGWIDRISLEDNAYVVESFGPGTALDASPDHTGAARRVE